MADINTKDEGALKMTRLEWGVLFSVIVSAASLIFSAGVVWTTVQVHDKAIQELRTSRDNSIERLASIEAKIDLMLEREKSK